MNDWKDLKIDNLPPDILTGDYEFEVLNGANWRMWDRNIHDLIYYLMRGNYKYRYRKPEPKAPSHEEKLSLWWEIWDDCWQKVDTVTVRDNETFYVFNGNTYKVEMNDFHRSCVNADWFIGKKSATIPPKGKENE